MNSSAKKLNKKKKVTMGLGETKFLIPLLLKKHLSLKRPLKKFVSHIYLGLESNP